MSEVLVVVDHVDGAIRKPTYELLTLARKLGEASAVFFGSSVGFDSSVGVVPASAVAGGAGFGSVSSAHAPSITPTAVKPHSRMFCSFCG